MSEDITSIMKGIINKSISNIILDPSIISSIIWNYFKDNNNIYIGKFLHKNRESKEVSAFYTGEYIIIDKYTFVNENIYYDVHIRYFVDEHDNLVIRDKVIFIIDTMTVTIHSKIEDLDPEFVLNTSFKRCDYDKLMIITPNMKLFDADRRFGYMINAKLTFDYNIKFDKEVDN
jgi:hypothetical protein